MKISSKKEVDCSRKDWTGHLGVICQTVAQVFAGAPLAWSVLLAAMHRNALKHHRLDLLIIRPHSRVRVFPLSASAPTRRTWTRPIRDATQTRASHREVSLPCRPLSRESTDKIRAASDAFSVAVWIERACPYHSHPSSIRFSTAAALPLGRRRRKTRLVAASPACPLLPVLSRYSRLIGNACTSMAQKK